MNATIVCIVSHDPHYTKTFLEYWKLEGQDAKLIFNNVVEFGAINIHHQRVANQYSLPVWNCQQSPQLLAVPQ